MNHNKFKKVHEQKINRKFHEHKTEAYDLKRKFIKAYPELTDQQALLSAYIMSGRGNLEVSNIKIGK